MASLITNKLKKLLLDKGIDLVNDSGIKVALLDTGYTPLASHSFASAFSGHELSGTGYTGGFGGSGRKALASRATTQDDGAGIAYFDAADLTWTGINAGTVGFFAVLKEVASDADSPLLAICDVSPDVVTNGGSYTLQFAADGVLKLT